MKKQFITSLLMTLVTTILLGIIYPLVITGIAQALFPGKANGQLVIQQGQVVGSRIIGQPFTSPSAAGDGYDASNSSGSNLGPTNKKLIERVNADALHLQAENPGNPVPVDLVTTSGSGLDPDISPAAALFQVPRIARERRLPEERVRQLMNTHVRPRQFGVFGEPSVNVLELNLDLDGIGARD
jgi:potassium-transporting ATPase KdpC subunit